MPPHITAPSSPPPPLPPPPPPPPTTTNLHVFLFVSFLVCFLSTKLPWLCVTHQCGIRTEEALMRLVPINWTEACKERDKRKVHAGRMPISPEQQEANAAGRSQRWAWGAGGGGGGSKGGLGGRGGRGPAVQTVTTDGRGHRPPDIVDTATSPARARTRLTITRPRPSTRGRRGCPRPRLTPGREKRKKMKGN